MKNIWKRSSLFALSITALIAAPLFCAALPLAAHAQEAPAAAAPIPQKRVAVMNFDYSTLNTWWGANTWDVGKGVSDLLVNELVKKGAFALIERQRLSDVLQEQDISNSNRADPATAVKVGKMLGANAIIVGSITQFGFDDKSIGLGAAGDKFGVGDLLGRVKKKESKAIVVVTARLIDPATGVILATGEGKGESKRGSWGGLAGGYNRTGSGALDIDMSADNFQNTILGEATRKCVTALADEIVKGGAKIQVAAFVFKGKIADVDGSTVIVSAGSEMGVKVGDTLEVMRVVREVKDPDTGAVLKTVTEAVGTLTISSVDAKSATGTFRGVGKPKVGDQIRKK